MAGEFAGAKGKGTANIQGGSRPKTATTAPKDPAKAQQSNLSPGLNSTLGELGIDPSLLSRFGGGGIDPNDPPVLVARPTRRGFGGFVDESDIRNASEVELDLYRLAPPELAALQKRLFDAGFYPGDVDLEDIDFGNYDEDTARAWATAVKRAANFFAAGQDKTLDEIIGESASIRLASGRGGKKGGSGQVAQLPNPLDIRKVAEGVAKKVIGRKLEEGERESLVKFYQDLHLQYYRNLASGTDTVTTPPDADVFIEDELERRHPVDASAMKIGETLSAFDQIVRGGGR